MILNLLVSQSVTIHIMYLFRKSDNLKSIGLSVLKEFID